jgi:hypothetical protein
LRQHPQVFAGSPNEIKFITEGNGLVDLVFGIREFVPSQMSRKGMFYSKLPVQRSINFRYQIFRKRVLGDWWNRTNRLGLQSGLHRSMSKKSMEKLLDKLKSDLDNPVIAAREFIHGYIVNHIKYGGENFWIDTTPANIMYSDLIHKILPEAKFIEMRRSPLDNIASVLKEPWGPNNLEKAMTWFMDRIDLANQAKSKVPTKLFQTYHLEDLVRDNRKGEFERLQQFTNLSSVEMQSYFDHEVSPEKAHFERWRADFADPDSIRAQFAQSAKERSFIDSF